MTQPPDDQRIKVFISYSWTSEDHQQWVLDLANRLTEANVHALLDLWDLQPGDDAIQFMERMVNDATVGKVLILADKEYVERAQGRRGGVGTETQIISPELYGQTESRKFVLVVAERDKNGKAYLPTYYKSRIYIDLSDEHRYPDEFEKLLRWIHDRPAQVRPAFGSTPTFLLEEAPTDLGTALFARRAIDTLRTGKPHAIGAFNEYLETLASHLERLRIVRENGKEFDDQVVESFANFKPFRDEFLDVINVALQHSQDTEFAKGLHHFFEAIYVYNERNPTFSGSYYTIDFDNFRLICRELFLVTIALALRLQRLDVVHYLVVSQYYITAMSGNTTMYPFGIMAREVESLEVRRRRLSSHRSLMADLLVERTSGSRHVRKEDLLQADFFLHLRSLFADEYQWHPATHVFAGGLHRPFEIFARASSRPFFDRVAAVLGVRDVAQFRELIGGMRQYGQGFNATSPGLLTAIDELYSRD